MSSLVRSGKATLKEGISVAWRRVDLHGDPKVRCQKRQRPALVVGIGKALKAKLGEGLAAV